MDLTVRAEMSRSSASGLRIEGTFFTPHVECGAALPKRERLHCAVPHPLVREEGAVQVVEDIVVRRRMAQARSVDINSKMAASTL